jgi:hypothetical protein
MPYRPLKVNRRFRGTYVSIFSVENEIKQKTSKKQRSLPFAGFLLGLLFDPE